MPISKQICDLSIFKRLHSAKDASKKFLISSAEPAPLCIITQPAPLSLIIFAISGLITPLTSLIMSAPRESDFSAT